LFNRGKGITDEFMAQSFFTKLQILISASLHSIVDRALEQNSLGVFDEYIRQAENSMATLKSAMVDMNASIKTLKRKYDESANEAAALDLQVDQALKSNKETLAKAQLTRLNAQLDIARTYQDQYEKQSHTYATLLEVVQILQAKVDVLSEQRDQVATLLELIKSKKIIARSIKDVRNITDDRTAKIVDNVRSQLDQADARLEVATSRLSDEIQEDAGDANLEAQLEQRRQKLGLT
jgi:phage shock protein A